MPKYTAYILTILAATPTVVFGAARPTDFKSFIALINDIIGTVILLVFALTFIALIWGVVKGWIINGGEVEGVENGKKVVFAGIIALVVMSSIWGIVYFLQSSLFGGS